MALPHRDVPATLRVMKLGAAVWVLRPPWDLETIRRVGEVRAALGA